MYLPVPVIAIFVPMGKRFVAVAAASMIAAMGAPQAMALTNQGDQIMVGFKSICTVGYIDPSHMTMQTAGHCGTPGDLVYEKNSPIPIGVVAYSSGDYASPGGDRMTIVANPLAAGNNVKTGDKAYSPKAGDKVCRYGAESNKVVCGKVYRVNERGMMVVDPKVAGIPGDSGGPMWVPGKGYVGTYTGRISKVGDQNGALFTIGFTRAPGPLG